MSDTISRQEMLRTYQELCMDIACSECSFYFGDALTGDCLFEKWIHSLPSAEPEIKPISYMDCANAMLKMWIDNVLTDGEYNRIMDKLNSKHMADMRGEQDEY